MGVRIQSVLLCFTLILGSSSIAFGEEKYSTKYATKGQVTEALFILQNKQRELTEYIQKLKKKLTDCFAQRKKTSNDGAQARKQRISHCALYQRILPTSIKRDGNTFPNDDRMYCRYNRR